MLISVLDPTSRSLPINREAEENREYDDSRVGKYDNCDELIDAEEEDAVSVVDASNVIIPSKLKAVIKFGFDEALSHRLDSVETDFTTWITSVMAHVQSYYQHSSLGTKILLEVCSYNCMKYYVTVV